MRRAPLHAGDRRGRGAAGRRHGDAAVKPPLTSAEVVGLHERLCETRGWPAQPAAPGQDAPWPAIEANHRCNARLWREEDLARRTHVADAEIVANKRAIDVLNQQRNDAVERIDATLAEALADAMRG